MNGSREFGIEFGRQSAEALRGEHLFERAGMGKAPFRCVSYVCRNGSCNYCGTPNRYAAVIESADGRQHEVGLDCVEKIGAAGLVKNIKNSAEYREFQRAKRHAKDEAIAAELPGLIERVRAVNEYMADYYARALPYCGASGRARKARAMRKLIAEAAATGSASPQHQPRKLK